MNENGNGKSRVEVPPPPAQDAMDAMANNAQANAIALLANAVRSRTEMMRQWADPRRDYENELGYPKSEELTTFGPMGRSVYKSLWDRDPIANRVVSIFPEEAWKSQPQVYETEDDCETPFEIAWNQIARKLGGESWFRTEEANPVWEYLKRVNVLSGIGSFGVLLIGIDDCKELWEPAFKVDESPSVTWNTEMAKKGRSERRRAKRKPTANFTGAEPDASMSSKEMDAPDADEEGAVGEEDVKTADDPENMEQKEVETKHHLTFLRPFDESLVAISEWESDRKNPRYGQPKVYQITLQDPNENNGGIGVQNQTVRVHWTRVLHVADGLQTNEVFAVPRMRPVLNRLLDLCWKLYGASAEGYWKAAFFGLSLETIPSYGGDVEINFQQVREELEKFWGGSQRDLVQAGMTAKPLAPTVADPTAQIAAHLQAICIYLSVPQRIFMGSERGELSSGQDADQWNDRLGTYQRTYLTPRLIVPFINRLIQLQCLPEPKGFMVDWPEPELAPADKANQANLITTALAAYVAGGVNNLIPSRFYLVEICGFNEKLVDAILEQAVEDIQDEEMDGEGGDADPLKIAQVQQKAEAAEQAEMMAEQAALGQEHQLGMVEAEADAEIAKAEAGVQPAPAASISVSPGGPPGAPGKKKPPFATNVNPEGCNQYTGPGCSTSGGKEEGGGASAGPRLAEKMEFQGKITKPKLEALKPVFAAAAAKVEAGMGPKAAELAAQNIKQMKVYDGAVKLVNDLRQYGVSGKAAGFYNRLTGDVGVVANPPASGKKMGSKNWWMSEGVLAHEVSHAIDGPRHSFSTSKEFVEVFNAHKDTLDGPAKVSKSEAFADLLREFLVPRETEYSLETFKQEPIAPPAERLPVAHAYFKKEGLIK